MTRPQRIQVIALVAMCTLVGVIFGVGYRNLPLGLGIGVASGLVAGVIRARIEDA